MFIPVSTIHQIAIVEALAREIWTEHYIPIIGKEQVEYMLERFQSRQAIAEQIGTGDLYYLIREGDACIGYMAVRPKDGELFLSKFYVKAARRGRGFGKTAVRFAETLAQERHLRRLTLTVNKSNTDSIKAYEHFGFHNVGSVIQGIGNGFVMDDYRMEKNL